MFEKITKSRTQIITLNNSYNSIIKPNQFLKMDRVEQV